MLMMRCCCNVLRYEYYNIHEYYTSEGLARHQRNSLASMLVCLTIFSDDVKNCEFAMQYNYYIVARKYSPEGT